MWSPVKESHFDLHNPSMSAVVQELYAELPVVLSAERSALLSPTVVLNVEPETPAFVLSCGSGLPSEHQRTYGLEVCSQESHERPDYVGQMSGPRLRELLSKEPAGVRVLAGNEEDQDGSSAEWRRGQWREGAGATEDTRSAVEEGLGSFAPAAKAAYWPKEKEPQLIQAERELLPRPPCVERSDLLQSLEESQASVQETAESPVPPSNEGPGRTAEGTVHCGRAGENSPRGRAGESSAPGRPLPKVEVSGASAGASPEPVCAEDDALVKGCLRGEEDRRRAGSCTAWSATTRVLSAAEAGGATLWRQGLGHAPPSQPDEMNLPDDSRSASGLESVATLDPLWLTPTAPETPNSPFQGCLERRHVLWEEDTGGFEIACEMEDEPPPSGCRCVGGTVGCGNVELLEDWTSQENAGGGLSPAHSGEELSSDSDVEPAVGSRTDHSYSRACAGGGETETGSATQGCPEGARANPGAENGLQGLPVCQRAEEKSLHPKSNTSFLLDAGRSSPAGRSGHDLTSVPSEPDGVQRDRHQPLPKDSVQEGSTFPCKEASSSVCFWRGCSTSPLPLLACHAPFSWDCGPCQAPLQQAGSPRSPRTGIDTSPVALRADNSPHPGGLPHDEEKAPPAQPGDEPSVAPGSGPVSSPGGLLDSLPEEGPSGTCAELGAEGAGSLQDLWRAAQDGGSCAVGSGASQGCSAVGLNDVEKRLAEVLAMARQACSPRNWPRSHPGSSAGCTVSGSVRLQGRAPEQRTETNTKPVAGLEMGHAPVSAPLQEHHDVKAHDPPSCENFWVDLDGAESRSGSLCSPWASSPCLSRAGAFESAVEIEGRRVEGESCLEAEDTLGVDARVDPPGTNLEQIVAPSAAGPGGMETVGSETVEEDGHGASEKPRGNRCVDKTVHPLELGQLAADPGEEEPGRVHVPPSSLAADLCRLNTALKPSPPDLAQEQGCPLQQREAIRPEESQFPGRHPHSLHGPASRNRETPDKEVLEGPLVVSGWQETDAGQAATHLDQGTPEPACCAPRELLGLKSDGDTTPPASVLVMQDGVRQAFQRKMAGRRPSGEAESESVCDPWKREPVALQRTQPPSEGLEGAFEQLQLNSPAAEQAEQMDTADSCSASRLARASLSDVQDTGRSSVCSCEFPSPSKQGCFPPALNPLAITHGQPGAEGSSLTAVTPGVQPGASLSLKKDPSTSLPPQGLCCPPAQEHLAPTVSWERGGGCRARSLASGSNRGSLPPQEECFGSSPGCQETPRSGTGSKAGAAMPRGIGCPAPSPANPSRKRKPSLGDPPREGGQAAGKTDWPASSFSSPVGSSGPSPPGVRHIAGEGERTVPFGAEAGAQQPFDPSDPDQSEEPASVKDPSKAAVRNILGHPRRPPDLRSSRSPGVRHHAVPRAPLGGSGSEASPKRIKGPGRRWRSTERSRELSGLKPEALAHRGNQSAEVPVKQLSGTEECPEPVAKARRREAGRRPDLSCAGLRAKPQLAAGHLWRRRRRQPLGSSFRRAAVKLDIPTQQTFARGCVAEGGQNGGTRITLRESQRPKILTVAVELGCVETRNVEAGSSGLAAESCGRTGTEIPVPLAPGSSRGHQAAGCGIRRASGGARKAQVSLLFSRPPGRAQGRASGPGQFKAARKSGPVTSPARLKRLQGALSQCRSEPVDFVCPALQAGAPRKARTLLWNQTPEQSASPSSLGGPLGLGQPAKEQAVLWRLSALADKLQAPRRLAPPWPSRKLLPVAGRRRPLLSQKLLEALSGVDVKFGCWWTNDGRGCSSTSGSLALYPLASVGLRVLGLGHRAPLSFSAPLFPVSFHIALGPVPARSLRGLPSLQGVPRQVAVGERDGAWTSSRWTLSVLFSRSCPGVEEGAWTPQSSPSASKDRGKDAVAQRSPGCPLRGLQTLLALSSPRCCRLWTRKRTPSRRPPAAQRLTVLQLLQDLKGLTCSSADLLSSAPHSLGRVLPVWSQRSPSEFTPPHSSRRKWQPVPTASTSLGLGNSPAMLPQVPDRILSAPWAVAAAVRLEAPVPPFPASLPASCSAPEPALLSLGLSAPEFPVLPLDQLDVSVPALPKTGTCLEKADSEKRPKKVSQIRIRKTVPKPDPNLTPMGLPRPKRLKKKEFSLEEIYTNKNYKSPPTTRCLETIFEEPKERNGSLISVSQQKRKRILEFQDFTVPRKRKVRSRVKVLGSSTRAQKAALQGRELDGLLIQRLTDLEAFFAEEEQKEQVAGS